MFIILLCMGATVCGCGQEKKESPLPETSGDVNECSIRSNGIEDTGWPKAPDLPPRPDTLRIAVISDINAGYGSVGYGKNVSHAISDIIKKRFDFVLSSGDLVAGQRSGLDYDKMWQAFHYEVGDILFDNNMEFIMAPGNHDASAYPQHQRERVAYARAFKDRHPKAPLIEGGHFPFYYAVILRDILVIALDITRPLKNDDPQLDWLNEVLASHKNMRATIVLGHLPLAPVNPAQFWDTAQSPRLLKMLQNTPGAIYISGHHHIYYPGHIGELRTIAVPALGSGARSFLGMAPVSGYVQIEIPPQGPPRVYALIAPDFLNMIDIQKLPIQIFKTQREDIGMAEFIIEMLDEKIHPLP